MFGRKAGQNVDYKPSFEVITSNNGQPGFDVTDTPLERTNELEEKVQNEGHVDTTVKLFHVCAVRWVKPNLVWHV